MPLTPDEIAGKEFTSGLRGYDHDEVRAFLKLVAAELEDTAGRPPASSGGDGVAPEVAASDAATILQRAHDEAVEVRQSAAAEAEVVRARARAVLSAAQEEALRLVAEAHVRIDRRAGSGGAGAPTSTVEQLGEEISAMVHARDEVLRQLRDVRAEVDRAVAAAEAEPVVGRSAAPRPA